MTQKNALNMDSNVLDCIFGHQKLKTVPNLLKITNPLTSQLSLKNGGTRNIIRFWKNVKKTRTKYEINDKVVTEVVFGKYAVPEDYMKEQQFLNKSSQN